MGGEQDSSEWTGSRQLASSICKSHLPTSVQPSANDWRQLAHHICHLQAMAGCLGGRQRLAGAKPLDGHLPTKASQRLAGWGAANG